MPLTRPDEGSTGATDSAAGNKTNTPAERWAKRIEGAERQFQEWVRRADKVVKIYSDERGETDTNKRQYAMLWANTEVLKPTVYSRAPVPAVTRRFRDKDPVGRQVADVMERALVSQYELNDADDVFRDVRDDFVLVGRGTAWVRYEVNFADHDPEYADGEDIIFDHVHYSDFVHPMRRKWRDVPWVARRVHMDNNAIEKRFGKAAVKKVAALDFEQQRETEQHSTRKDRHKRTHGTLPIYEIWDKNKRKVYWLAKGLKEFLDERDPPLTLRGFFPTPKPAYGTLPTDSLAPVPDYRFYQDQAEEINELTERIALLTEALKLTGFYPAAMDGDVSSALKLAASPQNKDMLVAVPGWSNFQTAGGSRELIQWWPVEAVITTISAAIETRRSLIGDIFQITGISDIVRGESDPRETLGAQELKSQFGSVRIREKQREMQRYIADMTAMAGEIIADLFDQKALQEITGIQLPTNAELEQQQQQQMLAQQLGLPAPEGLVPDDATLAQQQGPQQPGLPVPQQAGPIPSLVQGIAVGTDPTELMDAPDQDPMQKQVTWDQVIELMRNDRMMGYRVEIETDSTLEPDELREKQQRNELLEVISIYVERAAPIIQQSPTMGRLLGELLTFQLRAYRIGRQFEQIVEETVDQLIQEALQAAQQPQEPEAVQIERIRQEMKMQGEDSANQVKAIELQNDRDLAAARLAMESRIKMQELQAKQQDQAAMLQLEQEKVAAQISIDQQKAAADAQVKAQQLQDQMQIKIQELQQKEMLERETIENNAAANDNMGQIQNIAAELAEALSEVNAPRRVIRDEAGMIVGTTRDDALASDTG